MELYSTLTNLKERKEKLFPVLQVTVRCGRTTRTDLAEGFLSTFNYHYYNWSASTYILSTATQGGWPISISSCLPSVHTAAWLFSTSDFKRQASSLRFGMVWTGFRVMNAMGVRGQAAHWQVRRGCRFNFLVGVRGRWTNQFKHY